MTLEQLQASFQARQAELATIVALGNQATESDVIRGETLSTELTGIQAQITTANEATARRTALATNAETLSSWASEVTTSIPLANPPAPLPVSTGQRFSVPATVYRVRTNNFKDGNGFTAVEKAYGFGQWVGATVGRSPQSQQWCREHGIPLVQMTGERERNFVHVENVNTTGGFLVPPIWENELIDLRESYGVVRKLFKNRPMTSDTLNIPRRTGGLTAYWVSDAQAITESTKGWDLVGLSAKKIGVLAKYSSELAEDAIINIADDLAGEIAYAFAKLEDDSGLIGDGTSTYGGITGVTQALLGLSATRANIAGLVVGTGNLWSELTLADFNYCKARLPKYAAQSKNCVWVCSQQFWSAVMERLALAAGGITDAMIAAGFQPRFLGYPVVLSQSMPILEANDHVACLLGDFSLGAAFGDRRMTTIALSEHVDFASDQLNIRGTERFDIVVHDVGNQSATAASRVAGPIVGLLTAAS